MLKLLSGVLIMFLAVCLQEQDSFQSIREEMVATQIQARGITNKSVLEAMRKVPRHKFVPDKLVQMAYHDGALPIGHQQTISQPFIVAYMTEILKPEPDFKVLEIGTGSGYQAAVMAEIVDKVCTIEIVPELGEQARERLSDLGYDNIDVRIGDGYYGWESEAPFDAIIVTAAPEKIPQPLIDQLKNGGHMIIPVGPQSKVQYLRFITKTRNKIIEKEVMPVRFVPFKH